MLKDLLIKYGVIEPPFIPSVQPDTQDIIEEGGSRQINEFLEKALSRYCLVCDEFFKRPHSLRMHKLSKEHAKRLTQ